MPNNIVDKAFALLLEYILVDVIASLTVCSVIVLFQFEVLVTLKMIILYLELREEIRVYKLIHI